MYFLYCVAIKQTHASAAVLHPGCHQQPHQPLCATLFVLLISILGKYSLKHRHLLKLIWSGANHDSVGTGLLSSMSSSSSKLLWRWGIKEGDCLLISPPPNTSGEIRHGDTDVLCRSRGFKANETGSWRELQMRQRGQQCWHTDEIWTMRLKLALTDDKLYSHQTFIPSRKVSVETWWRTTKEQNTCAGSVAASTCHGDRDLTGRDSCRPLIQLMRLFTQHCWLDNNQAQPAGQQRSEKEEKRQDGGHRGVVLTRWLLLPVFRWRHGNPVKSADRAFAIWLWSHMYGWLELWGWWDVLDTGQSWCRCRGLLSDPLLGY